MVDTRVSRSRFLQVSGALATGGALAARSPLSALASRVGDQAVPLTFWTPGGSARWCNSLDTNARSFEQLHPKIHLNKVQCGTGQQDFQQVLLSRIASGNPPDALIWWDTPVGLAVRGALMPLDDLMAHSRSSQKKNWPASALASCQWGGKTYGLPATAGTMAMWYNADWFAKRGISTDRASFPKTWDGLRKLSKEFTSWRGDRLVTAGFIPMNPSDGNFSAWIYIWSALNGGRLFDAANHKYTIDAEPNVAMMEYMLSWLNEEYKGNMRAVQRLRAGQNAPPAFQNNQQAMVEQGFWFMGDIYNSPPKFKVYGVASYPVGPGGTKTVSGYWPNWLVIPQGSPHAQEAFQWLDYLGSVGIKLWFSITPDLPTNTTVPYLVPSVTVQNAGKVFADDVTRFFHQQLAVSIPMWDSPVQGFANDQIHRAVDRIMHKVTKPKDALAEAQRTCQAELDRVLKTR